MPSLKPMDMLSNFEGLQRGVVVSWLVLKRAEFDGYPKFIQVSCRYVECESSCAMTFRQLEGTPMLSTRYLSLIVALTLVTQSGCLTLSSFLGQKRKPGIDTSMLGYQIPPGGMPSQVPESIQLTGSEFILELRGSEKQMAAIRLDPEKGMTVEEMVKKTNLTDKMGRPNIYIMRPTLDAGTPIRLDSKLDGKGKCVNPGNNYAIRPGDHVIAVDDGRSLFERFIDEKLGRDQ